MVGAGMGAGLVQGLINKKTRLGSPVGSRPSLLVLLWQSAYAENATSFSRYSFLTKYHSSLKR